LDVAVSQATGLNLANSDLEVEDKTETIRKLRHRVQQLEEQVDLVGAEVDGFRQQLDERDREISKLRRMVHID
jgi:predicted nuclease with TOPRIM domain